MCDVIDDQRTTPSELRKKLLLAGFANAERLVLSSRSAIVGKYCCWISADILKS